MAGVEAQEGKGSSCLPKGCLATHKVAITGCSIFDLVEHVVSMINSMRKSAGMPGFDSTLSLFFTTNITTREQACVLKSEVAFVLKLKLDFKNFCTLFGLRLGHLLFGGAENTSKTLQA